MANPINEKGLVADKNGKPMLALRQALVADAKVNYATPGLDTEAEVIVAINATNTTVNAILDILEAHGLMADA